jgi:hypothetical protein
MNQTLEHQRTARLAYQIWEDEGCPEGRCEVHWRQAEQQLRAERDAAANTVNAEQDMGRNDATNARSTAPMRDTRPVLATRPAAAVQAH